MKNVSILIINFIYGCWKKQYIEKQYCLFYNSIFNPYDFLRIFVQVKMYEFFLLQYGREWKNIYIKLALALTKYNYITNIFIKNSWI